jgi:hypothetical protein
MKPTFFYHDKVADSAVRRLSKKVDVPMLVALSMSDKEGRESAVDLKAENWMMEKYKELKLDQPDALAAKVMGRHLIPLGVPPGPEMGKILGQIYEAQLEGKFETAEEGVGWAKQQGLVKSKKQWPQKSKKGKLTIHQRRKIEIRDLKDEFTEKVEGGFDYDRWAMGSRAPKRTKKIDPETEASIRRLFGKANDFVIDTKKSRKHLVDLRKSKLEGKKVPYRLNGHVVWSEVYKGGFIVKGKPELITYDSRVLLKSGIGFVTGIGKDGVIARDKSGKKHQVFYKNLNLWIK